MFIASQNLFFGSVYVPSLQSARAIDSRRAQDFTIQRLFGEVFLFPILPAQHLTIWGDCQRGTWQFGARGEPVWTLTTDSLRQSSVSECFCLTFHPWVASFSRLHSNPDLISRSSVARSRAKRLSAWRSVFPRILHC